MGLIQAKGRLFSGVCGRVTTGVTGTTSAGYFAQRCTENWTNHGALRNFPAGEATASAIANRAARPYGYLPPHAWLLPVKGGGMGSTGRRIIGTGTVTATGAMGKNATATLHGIGGFSPDPSLTLVVPASATLQGSGGLSPAPTLIGVANALATLAGTSTFEGTADALGHLAATLAGLGEITDAAQHATGHMAATVLPYSELSPQGLANAVWNALAAGSNEGGTMGEKLNAAGTAGDPWTAELPASYVDGTAGNIIAMIAALLRNKTVTDPATGVMTVYAENGVDVLFEADIFEDAAGAEPYDGQGVNRRDRLA